MNERLLFGVIIPAVIFLISLLATLFIYRRFARHSRSSHLERDKNK